MLASPLHTLRLALHPASLDLAIADLEDRSRFGHLLAAEIPTSWPPELYDLEAGRWAVRAIQEDPDAFFTFYSW